MTPPNTHSENNILINKTILKEKVMEISPRLCITRFSTSNRCIVRFKKSRKFPQNIFNANEILILQSSSR